MAVYSAPTIVVPKDQSAAGGKKVKRPHRRTHLLIWAIFAPLTAIAGTYFWTERPGEPVNDLPEAIAAIKAGD